VNDTWLAPNGVTYVWTGTMWSVQSGASAVTSFNTRTGAVTLSNTDVTTVLPPSSTTPPMDGTAAVGTGTTWARADHVHPTDTSRYAATNPSGFQTAANVTTALAAGQPGAFSTLSASGAVSGAGFTTLLTPYASLGSPTFTGTPAAPTVAPTAVAGTTQLATTQFVRAGTTTNDNALAGQVGEVITATATATAILNGVVTQVASIALTAGDWDIFGLVTAQGAGGAVFQNWTGGPSSSSSAFASYDVLWNNYTTAANALVSSPFPESRISLAAGATVYLLVAAGFASGTATGSGRITARRRR
jgi:hypothetical protein